MTTPKVETPKKLIMEVVILREDFRGCVEFILLAFSDSVYVDLGCLRFFFVIVCVPVYYPFVLGVLVLFFCVLFVGLIML